MADFSKHKEENIDFDTAEAQAIEDHLNNMSNAAPDPYESEFYEEITRNYDDTFDAAPGDESVSMPTSKHTDKDEELPAM